MTDGFLHHNKKNIKINIKKATEDIFSGFFNVLQFELFTTKIALVVHDADGI
jgi:hypothetical protein